MPERKPKKLPRTLTISEIHEMIVKAPDRDKFLLELLFYSGLRNNEARLQKIEDIDLANGIVHVKAGKGKKDREVPVSAYLKNRIKNFINDRKTGWLFVGRDKFGCLSGTQIRRIVKKCAVIANLRKPFEVHPHTLRHSYATFLRNNDVPLEEIQKLLGHEKLDTTMIYSRLAIDKIQKNVSRAFEKAEDELHGGT